jgi:DNA polymerase III sliding clamp (beta) subunit (PCNA family)
MSKSFILEIDSKKLISMSRLSGNAYSTYSAGEYLKGVHVSIEKNKGYHLVATNRVILGVFFVEDESIEFDRKFTIPNTVISLVKTTKDKTVTLKISESEVALKTSVFKKKIDETPFDNYPDWKKVLRDCNKTDYVNLDIDLGLTMPIVKLFSELNLGVAIAQHCEKGIIIKSEDEKQFIGIVRGRSSIGSGIDFEALGC